MEKDSGNRPSRNKEEILVVGGSAAGLYTAARLAEAGKPVRVLESRPTLEATERTLIVTDHFRNQISAKAKSCILNEINRFELFTNGRSAHFSLKRPDLIIERSQVDSIAIGRSAGKRERQSSTTRDFWD